MCTTEEHAIKNFISKNRIITIEKKNIPTTEKEKKKQEREEQNQKTQRNFSRPKDPILSIILAKIIEQQPKALT